ncbi:MAG: twin-arginine translocase subunit TatC [Bacteroidetes bacterium]|nr:twin-arginine translocase subunit TatC [Bacteroidota bacterium]
MVQQIKESKDTEEKEMSFFDHLEDLRNRIVFSIIGIAVGCVISGLLINQIMELVLLRPATDAGLELQNLRPFGQPFLYFKVVLVVGIIFSIPWTLYQIWKFVAPGLYGHERNWAGKITFFTTFCFLAGVAFAYFGMIPGMMKFTVSFGTTKIKNMIDVTEYFGFVTTTILGAGLVFELPMVAYVLSRVGILTPAFMRKYRRHAYILILVVAAVLTPSPDPINQLIFATPMVVLYEISIIVSKLAGKKETTP